MNKFEAILLFNPDLPSDTIDAEDDNFKKNISTSDGKIISNEDWGLRDLSYKINSYKKAFYKFYQIEIKGTNIADIKKILTQNEKIVRHLFVKVEEHQELPTKMKSNEEN